MVPFWQRVIMCTALTAFTMNWKTTMTVSRARCAGISWLGSRWRRNAKQRRWSLKVWRSIISHVFVLFKSLILIEFRSRFPLSFASSDFIVISHDGGCSVFDPLNIFRSYSSGSSYNWAHRLGLFSLCQTFTDSSVQKIFSDSLQTHYRLGTD